MNGQRLRSNKGLDWMRKIQKLLNYSEGNSPSYFILEKPCCSANTNFIAHTLCRDWDPFCKSVRDVVFISGEPSMFYLQLLPFRSQIQCHITTWTNKRYVKIYTIVDFLQIRARFFGIDTILGFQSCLVSRRQ